MNSLIEHAGPLVALGSVVINFLWSSVNLRLMRNMERRFVSREYFHAEQRVQAVMHSALSDRVRKLEARGAAC